MIVEANLGGRDNAELRARGPPAPYLNALTPDRFPNVARMAAQYLIGGRILVSSPWEPLRPRDG